MSVLTYFQGRGRAELIRLMLEVTGSQYEERCITKPLLQDLRRKGDLYFDQLPLLEMDGLKLVQSAAIVRYLARKHDMYGRTPLEAMECDMIADGLFDFRENFILFLQYKLKQEDPASFDGRVRDKLLPQYIGAMEAQLKRNIRGGGKFLVGENRSYADIALLEVLELVEEMYPGLVTPGTSEPSATKYPLVASFHQHIRAVDEMTCYLASDRRNPPVNNEYIASVLEVLG